MLAVSIKNGWLRYAQGDVTDHKFTLNQFDEISLPQSLVNPDLSSKQLSDQIRVLFHQVVDSLEHPDREVFLSLGAEWIESYLLSVDERLSSREKEEFLRWVLAQRQGLLWNESIAFFQTISNSWRQIENVIACTTTQNVVESVKTALDLSGSVPVWLEPSLFSVHRVVTEFDDGLKSKIITIDSNDHALHAQFLNRGRLEGLAHLNIKSGIVSESAVQGDQEFVSKCVGELNDYLEKKKPDPDLRVVLTGRFSKRVLDTLRKNDEKEEISVLLDPFINMDSKKSKFPDSTNGSLYVEVVGLIQRRVI